MHEKECEIVFTSFILPEAEIALEILRSAGIAAFILNRNFGTMSGGIAVPFKVVVPGGERAAALKLLGSLR